MEPIEIFSGTIAVNILLTFLLLWCLIGLLAGLSLFVQFSREEKTVWWVYLCVFVIFITLGLGMGPLLAWQSWGPK